MSKLLPFSLLLLIASLFGLLWIVTGVDPSSARWYIFGAFIFLLFVAAFNSLGLLLYFVRTRFYKRYSSNWYAKTSYKMAFFVAAFVVIAAVLAIFSQMNTFNLVLAILAIALLALWSYLGRDSRG